MQSQTPERAAAYFKLIRVDTAEHRPVVTAIFTPAKGWVPATDRRPVSHVYLVLLRDNQGVAGVQLTAGRRSADFQIGELIGHMGLLDAEMTDGIPVSEGSGVTADRDHMTEVLAELGFTPAEALSALARADEGGVEFTSERRSFSAVDPRGSLDEGWRYRLTARKQITGGGPGYALDVLVHESREG